MRKRFWLSVQWVMAGCVALGLLALAVGPVNAEMATAEAYFSDGNGTDPDGFPGSAGNGWGSQWWDGDDPVTATITNDDPLSAGGGNYLHNASCSNDHKALTVARRYYEGTEGGVIDLTKPHTVEFKIRIDEDIWDENSTFWDDTNDRYQIFDYNQWRDGGTTLSASWAITCIGAEWSALGVTSDMVGNWVFYDGIANGTWGGSMVDSEIAVTPGAVYEFTVTVDPDNQEWDVSVTDGTNSFSQTDMGWIAGSLGGYLHVTGIESDEATDGRAYSLDDVVITEVPEPSTLTLLLAAALAGLAMRRRE
jgi:hypothetical protein